MTRSNFLKAAAAVVLISVILYFGRVLFIPLFFALLISFIAYPGCKWLERKKIPSNVAIGLSLFIMLLPIAGLIWLLLWQLTAITEQWSLISTRLLQAVSEIQLPFGIILDKDGLWIREIIAGNSGSIYSGVISSGATLVQIVIIPFYVALFLYHRTRLINFVRQLFPQVEASQFKMILEETVVTYYNFVKGMIVVYVIVGILNSAGLFLLGIPNALVFGLTASILTFIPYIGIIIGATLPAAVAWSITGSIYYPLGVIAVFTIVQFLEANFIFPIAVSQRIKINTLFTLISIFAGGILWGAAGMILFIPFLSILKLVSEKFEGLKPVGNLLSAD